MDSQQNAGNERETESAAVGPPNPLHAIARFRSILPHSEGTLAFNCPLPMWVEEIA